MGGNEDRYVVLASERSLMRTWVLWIQYTLPEDYEVAAKDSELRFGQAGIDIWQDGRRFISVNR